MNFDIIFFILFRWALWDILSTMLWRVQPVWAQLYLCWSCWRFFHLWMYRRYSMFDLEMHLIDPPHYRIYIKLAKFTLYKCNLPIIRHILIFNIGISECWSQVNWDKCQWIPGEYHTVYRLDNLYWIVSSVIFDMNMTANQSIMTKIMALSLIMSSEYKLTKF